MLWCQFGHYFSWSWVWCTCTHERFPKCFVWWCCAPQVHPTCIFCQCVVPLIWVYHPTLIDHCGLVRKYDRSHTTVQCHWLQQSFPNGWGYQFPISPIVLLDPIWLKSHWWSLLLLLFFVLFCMNFVRWIPRSSYVMWAHQLCWISWLFLRVDAGLWPSTWSIRVVFVVPLWLRIFHSLGISWSILRMLFGSLRYPHRWGVWFFRVPSTCILGCYLLLLVCWCPTS